MSTSTSQYRFNEDIAFTVNMADIAETPEYLSVPVVFTKEGVHNGYLKTYASIKATAKDLVGKPVVIGHPEPKRPVNSRDPVTGEIISAEPRDSDKSLHGRIKITKSKAPSWLIESIKLGKLRGGSLGYYSTITPFGGYYQGKPYSGVETIDSIDHYAIGLEDGAASVKDGCGLRFNSKEGDDDVPTMKGIKSYFTELLKKEGKEGKNILSETDKRLEKLEQKLETQTTQIKDWETKYADLQKKLDDTAKLKVDAEGKLKIFADKEAKLEQDKKDALIKEIIADTEDKPEQYKDWTTTQLEILKTKLTPAAPAVQPLNQAAQASTDQKAKTPPTTQGTTQPNGLSIGNSLFGKKMGEV